MPEPDNLTPVGESIGQLGVQPPHEHDNHEVHDRPRQGRDGLRLEEVCNKLKLEFFKKYIFA